MPGHQSSNAGASSISSQPRRNAAAASVPGAACGQSENRVHRILWCLKWASPVCKLVLTTALQVATIGSGQYAVFTLPSHPRTGFSAPITTTPLEASHHAYQENYSSDPAGD